MRRLLAVLLLATCAPAALAASALAPGKAHLIQKADKEGLRDAGVYLAAPVPGGGYVTALLAARYRRDSQQESISLQRLKANGAPSGEATELIGVGARFTAADLALAPDGRTGLAVWISNKPKADTLYARPFDAIKGEPTGAARVVGEDVEEATLASSGDGYLLTNRGTVDEFGTVQRLDAEGTPVGQAVNLDKEALFKVDTYRVLEDDAGSVRVVTIYDSGRITSRALDGDGSLGPATEHGDYGRAYLQSIAALPNGEALLLMVEHDRQGLPVDLVVRRLPRKGELGPPKPVKGAPGDVESADLALRGDRGVVVWTQGDGDCGEVYGVATDGKAVARTGKAVVVGEPTGCRRVPLMAAASVVAAPGGRFLLTWRKYGAGRGEDVFARVLR